MAYIYICTPCKIGMHRDCQATADLPEDGEDLEMCGGGFCICDHTAEYLNTEDYYNSKRANERV